jgi:ABC-type multidrug transport system fused ATPase/permease subunit
MSSMSAASTLLKPFIRDNKVLMISSIVTGLLNNIFTLLLTLTIGKFFDDAFAYHTNKGRILSLLGLHLDKSLFHFFLFFSALIIAKLIIGWADAYFTALNGEGLSKRLREKLFEKQLYQEYESFHQKETGKYLLRYSGDMRSMQTMLTKGVIGFIKDILFIITGIFFLLQLQSLLAVTFLLFALFLILLTMVFDKKLKRLTEERRNIQSNLLSFVTVRLLSLRSVKAFNKEPVEIIRFNKRSEINFQLARQYHFINSFIQSSAPVILYLSLSLTLWATTVYSSPVKGGVLLSYVLLTILLFPSLRKIIKIRTIWQSGNLSANKLQEIFAMPTEGNGDKKLKGNIHSITIKEFENDTTEDDEQIQISQTMLRGELYLLNHERGHSLMKLLTGIAKPSAGNIFINDTDISQFSKKSIRRKIAVSAGAFPLYGRSVYEAAAYGKNAENRESLQKLLQVLQFSADETVDIDKLIGMHGNQLQPGQKKILLHARALLTGKQVLLFEEPFSSLSISQAQALQKLLIQKTCTAIIIITGEELDRFKKTNTVIQTSSLN